MRQKDVKNSKVKHQFGYSHMWGYIAAASLLPYACLKSFWALGGTAGLTTEQAIRELTKGSPQLKEQSPFLYSLHSIGIDFTALLALLASLFAIWLISSRGRVIPKLVAGWSIGILTIIAAIFALLQMTGFLPKGSYEGLAFWVYVITYGGFFVWGISIFLATLYAQRENKSKNKKGIDL